MQPITLTRRQSDLIVFGFFLAVTIVCAGFTFSFPSPLLPGYPGSAMFPRIVLCAMGILSLFGLVRSLLLPRDGPGLKVMVPAGPLLLSVAGLSAFVLTLALAGMEPAVFGFIAVASFFRSRRLVPALISGLAATLVVYVIFVEALSVRLPLLVLPRGLLGI